MVHLSAAPRRPFPGFCASGRRSATAAGRLRNSM